MWSVHWTRSICVSSLLAFVMFAKLTACLLLYLVQKRTLRNPIELNSSMYTKKEKMFRWLHLLWFDTVGIIGSSMFNGSLYWVCILQLHNSMAFHWEIDKRRNRPKTAMQSNLVFFSSLLFSFLFCFYSYHLFSVYSISSGKRFRVCIQWSEWIPQNKIPFLYAFVGCKFAF